MGYKVGVICGSKIWSHSPNANARVPTCNALSQGTLDGVILTPETGGFGLSMVGANNLIFLGSMYTEDYEHQVLGKTFSRSQTKYVLARICRPGQTRTPRGFIIANVDFAPDNAAFKLKQVRGEDHKNMAGVLTPRELEVYLKARSRTEEDEPESDSEAVLPRDVHDLTRDQGPAFMDLTLDEDPIILD
jgi:hypothetical protein